MKKVQHVFQHAIISLTVLASRFIGLPPNFSPVGSYGFFGGNVLFYFASILAFDYLKGGFYKGFLFTYLGFLGYFIVGKIAKNNTRRQLVLLPLASVLFFILSNIGVWWFWYPRSLAGLMMCFTFALPFYRNTFLSDMFFGYAFLGVKVLRKRFSLDKIGQFKSLEKLA